MPGNQKPRRRKHRGTQTGSISRSASRSRPRNRQEAMAQARSRRQGGGGKRNRNQPVDRRDVPPTWRGAIIRGVIFAALLIPVSLLFGQELVSAIVLSMVAAVFYVPLGFYTESFFYRRRQQKLAQERAAAQAEKKGER